MRCIQGTVGAMALLVSVVPLCDTQLPDASGIVGVSYSRVWDLKPTESVFAYARVSPAGTELVYASEEPTARGEPPRRLETVVDLHARKVLGRVPGIDAYWSEDGKRFIYLDVSGDHPQVNIERVGDGAVRRDVAPASLGDYFSWGVKDDRDLIMTISGNYYFLNDARAVLPAASLASCPGIGRGVRPLISKDGTKVTVFVRSHVVIRNVDNCEGIVDTAIVGAKADFSWDGRYIAFHTPKNPPASGSEIVIVDSVRKTVRTLPALPGNSLFPSWTKDNRLCFRYDGDDYRGFMMASNVLQLPERPLPLASEPAQATVTWRDVFPSVPPAHKVIAVLIWSNWTAHAPTVLRDVQEARDEARALNLDVGVGMALGPGARTEDLEQILEMSAIRLDRLPLDSVHARIAGALNQSPTLLLFRNGLLVDRVLGPMSSRDIWNWITQAP